MADRAGPRKSGVSFGTASSAFAIAAVSGTPTRTATITAWRAAAATSATAVHATRGQRAPAATPAPM